MHLAAVGLSTRLHISHRRRWRALSGAGSRASRSHRLRSAFVVVQVGLALVLLICAGLVGRSFVNLLKIDIGFNPEHVLTLDVQLPDRPSTPHAFYAALLERVRALPGVEAAAAVFQRPLEHAGIGMDGTVLIEGQRTDLRVPDWERNPRVNLESATAGYFDAVGMPIVRGRAFAATDVGRAPRVAIVGERLARRLWPGQNPIGKRLSSPGARSDAQAGFSGRRSWVWCAMHGIEVDRSAFDLYLPAAQSDLRVKHLMYERPGTPWRLERRSALKPAGWTPRSWSRTCRPWDNWCGKPRRRGG